MLGEKERKLGYIGYIRSKPHKEKGITAGTTNSRNQLLLLFGIRKEALGYGERTSIIAIERRLRSNADNDGTLSVYFLYYVV
jgi:hypothetical protein